ncbi:putative flippase GtrA [Catenulispora sp. EB89]|uniref:GtrA family protein n=1 Tax=Catenulispora sp. EB89 TaxID=3156257 RepID=UPI003517A761
MTVVRSLYNRFEHLVHELSKFGVVGAAALLVNIAVLNGMLLAVKDKQIVATIVSTVVATCVAYVGNRYWTYKDRDKIDRHREMLFFFLINGVAAVIEVMFVFIAKYGLGEDSTLAVNVAKYVFGMPVGMLFRLYCYRTFVFPEGAEPEVVPAAASAPLYPVGQPAQNGYPALAPQAHVQQAHVHQRPIPETAGR